ncbi:DUF6417 family protein [Streptomyces chartreusis]|uniref:DUF6417 family protein n=1 Tax=Streptomyces chartreusis TaxID=1969 RepID=UPI0036378272
MYVRSSSGTWVRSHRATSCCRCAHSASRPDRAGALSSRAFQTRPTARPRVCVGLHLHRLANSEAEANRFARDYGVTYRPSPDTRTPVPVVIRQQVSSGAERGTALAKEAAASGSSPPQRGVMG